MKDLLIEVWQCLAFKGRVCPGMVLQYSLKEAFTLCNEFY
jgi:hypothetical protein